VSERTPEELRQLLSERAPCGEDLFRSMSDQEWQAALCDERTNAEFATQLRAALEEGRQLLDQPTYPRSTSVSGMRFL
jgi:hypothetical protein